MVTTGSWSPLASTNLAGDDPVHKTGFNHYSSACLQEAGGRVRGWMDMVQFHSYPWAGAWQTGAPWLGLSPASYLVEGPVGPPSYQPNCHRRSWWASSPVRPSSRMQMDMSCR